MGGALGRVEFVVYKIKDKIFSYNVIKNKVGSLDLFIFNANYFLSADIL